MPLVASRNPLTLVDRPPQSRQVELSIGPPLAPRDASPRTARSSPAFLLPRASRGYAPRVRRAPELALALLSVGLLGCLPSEEFPDGALPPKPASCGNGVCEPRNGEQNVSCVEDCPHCYAIQAVSSQGNADAATGREDGKTVEVGANGTLDLTFGREFAARAAAPDLQLLGSVTGSAPTPTTVCALDAPLSGAVQVYASDDSGVQRLIGFWTQGSTGELALRCGSGLTARYLRLVALPGASFRLDAAHALSCVE